MKIEVLGETELCLSQWEEDGIDIELGKLPRFSALAMFIASLGRCTFAVIDHYALRMDVPIENIVTHLENNDSNPLNSIEDCIDRFVSGAMEVDPDRAAFPEKAGSIKPKDLLAPERAEEFLDAESRAPLQPVPDSLLPRFCYRVPQSSEKRFRERLRRCEMASPILESKITKRLNGKFPNYIIQ